MCIIIRLAVPTDAPMLPLIERDAAQIFRSAKGLEWVADNVGEEGTYLELIKAKSVWVAEASEQACGFLAARIEGQGLHVVEISVCKEQQRQGIARALIQRAAAEARRLSLTALTLTTFRDLPWNEPHYSKLGFTSLNGADLPARLQKHIDLDAEAGLPRHRRCAMQLSL